MRFSLFINQAKAMEWGLNVQQAILFSYLHDLPTWGKCTVINGEAFWWSGKDKVICELPILTDKPDTVKRHMAALEKAGLIERITHQNRPLVRITDKGKQWNKHEGGGENNPDQGGKKIPHIRIPVIRVPRSVKKKVNQKNQNWIFLAGHHLRAIKSSVTGKSCATKNERPSLKP